MYLIISGEISSNYLKNELDKLTINAVCIPCIQSISSTPVINHLKEQINNFDIIITTSPTAINYAHEAFKVAAKDIIFVVPGFSSYSTLRQYTQNKIYYPNRIFGAEAIVDQVLENINLHGKKIAIIQGENANNTIQDYLKVKLGNDSYTEMIVYEQKWLDLDNKITKKLLIDSSMQGIILTSSGHARYLFSQGQKYGFYDMLLTADFITLHVKIEQVIRKLGAKGHIFISDHALMESLIDLVGRLHDGHSKQGKS